MKGPAGRDGQQGSPGLSGAKVRLKTDMDAMAVHIMYRKYIIYNAYI